MSISLELFLDHTCPFSYMAFSATGQVARDRGLCVRWRPIAITSAHPALSAADREMHTLHREADWPRIQTLAAVNFGLSLVRPLWGADARVAAAAAHWAAQQLAGAATEVHAALFRAYFGAHADIGDAAVLAELLRPLGVDTAPLADTLTSGVMDSELARDAAAAAAHGVTAVPALVAGTYILVGAQPLEVLERSLDRILRAGARSEA